MNLESELKQILDELKRYFEFQKGLGVEAIGMQRTNRKEAPRILITESVTPDASERKSVINVEQQLGIFDATSQNLTLEEIREEIGNCTRCKLHEKRTNIVFGEGNPKARLVFVGEGPGEEEDRQGRPFVGRAGQLLTKIIEAMGLKREDVYICNVVKCRPPGNRVPESDEAGTCEPFLMKQLRSIGPQVVVCLGNTAAQSLFKTKGKLGDLRGKFHTYGRSKLLVTYHPAALLRNPGFKKPLWDDMQIVMKELGLAANKSGD